MSGQVGSRPSPYRGTPHPTPAIADEQTGSPRAEMASEYPAPPSSQQPFANPQPSPVHPTSHATSPPTRQSLKAWWKGFRPPPKNPEPHGNPSSLDVQSFVGLETYYTSEEFVSKLPRNLSPSFQENTMSGGAPGIDGLPCEEASQASLLREPTADKAPDVHGQVCEEASRASSLQTSHKCSNLKAVGLQKLRGPRPSCHSGSILSNTDILDSLQQPTNADAKQRFSLSKEKTSSPSSTLVTGQDGERNSPRTAEILPSSERKGTCCVFDDFHLHPFSSNIFVVKIAKYFKAAEPQGIFGVPLRESIGYANVAISLVDSEGKSYIYGYVPIVVAKCGVYLKEKGSYCLLFHVLRTSANLPQSHQRRGDFPLEWFRKTYQGTACSIRLA